MYFLKQYIIYYEIHNILLDYKMDKIFIDLEIPFRFCNS